MKTISLVPDDQWVQVCDGRKNMLLQLISGAAAFCISDTMPLPDAAFHFMPPEVLIPVSPPTKVWVRSTHTWRKDTLIISSETE